MATRQAYRERESLSRQNSSVACTSVSCEDPGLVLCASRALSSRLCHAHLSTALACLSCVPGSIVGDRASLLRVVEQLCRAHCALVVCAVAHVGLRTPSSVVGDRTFCLSQPCQSLSRRRILCRNRISLTARATLSCSPKACRVLSRAHGLFSVVASSIAT